MDYEIAVFEYSDLYDGAAIVPADKVVEKFMDQFKHYLNPEYYPEDEVWFMRSRLFLSYRDKTGGDKERSEGARVCTHSATSVTEEVCVAPPSEV